MNNGKEEITLPKEVVRNRDHLKLLGLATFAPTFKALSDPAASLGTTNEPYTTLPSLFDPEFMKINVSSLSSSVIPSVICLNAAAEASSEALGMPFITESVTRRWLMMVMLMVMLLMTAM
jgi:hypothetical protein